MNPRVLFAVGSLVLLLALVPGCFDHEPTVPEETPTDSSTPNLEQARAEVRALLNELENDLAGLEVLAQQRATVVVPAGSVDALEGAIASAGPGGIVVVQSGLHTESETVTVPHRVTILGRPGAIVQVDTQPSTEISGLTDPAFHVLGAPSTWILGLKIQPAAAGGGTALLAEDSPRSRFSGNEIVAHEVGVALEQADRSVVWDNTITTSAGGYGVIVINAERTSVLDNEVSNATFGIWPCDRKGTLAQNHTHHNFIGIILCKVPPEGFILPDGEPIGAEFSTEQWAVFDNNSHENLDAGYLVIDGANHNLVAANAAAGNGTYEFELVGDSFRFGFLTPTSFDNVCIIPDPSDTVKDCGLNNTVIGGTAIDTDVDPCF